MKVVGARWTGEQSFKDKNGEEIKFDNTFFCVEYEDPDYAGLRAVEYKVPSEVLKRCGLFTTDPANYVGLDLFFAVDPKGKITEVFAR